MTKQRFTVQRFINVNVVTYQVFDTLKNTYVPIVYNDEIKCEEERNILNRLNASRLAPSVHR